MNLPVCALPGTAAAFEVDPVALMPQNVSYLVGRVEFVGTFGDATKLGWQVHDEPIQWSETLVGPGPHEVNWSMSIEANEPWHREDWRYLYRVVSPYTEDYAEGCSTGSYVNGGYRISFTAWSRG